MRFVCSLLGKILSVHDVTKVSFDERIISREVDFLFPDFLTINLVDIPGFQTSMPIYYKATIINFKQMYWMNGEKKLEIGKSYFDVR